VYVPVSNYVRRASEKKRAPIIKAQWRSVSIEKDMVEYVFGIPP